MIRSQNTARTHFHTRTFTATVRLPPLFLPVLPAPSHPPPPPPPPFPSSSNLHPHFSKSLIISLATRRIKTFAMDPPDNYPRNYRNNGRSRQLLSLPVSPTPYDLRTFDNQRRPKLYPRAVCPASRILRSIFLAFICILALFIMRPLSFHRPPPRVIVSKDLTSHNSALSFLHNQLPQNLNIPHSISLSHQSSNTNQPLEPKQPPSPRIQNFPNLITSVSVTNRTDTESHEENEQDADDGSHTEQVQNDKPQTNSESSPSTANSNNSMIPNPADFTRFDNNTALNYFHLHKTGGVSFKERLFDFFIKEEKWNGQGEKARVVDTCHLSGPDRPALGIEAKWSCDWGEIEKFSEKERNRIDVIVGHQYWEHGAGYWLPKRDLRYFTIMRHPLHRKISFFYHFFVRNAGRKESSVTTNEMIDFVLGKEMPRTPLLRDAGPGYYASRLWSDGISGYGSNNDFLIPEERTASLVHNSIRRLRRNFVFIGLQNQEKASLCMLKYTVLQFAKAHKFNNFKGIDAIAKPRERMNTGSYALSAEILWNNMTTKQKEQYKKVERVDLAIYRESVKMFHEMVKKFICERLVVDGDGDDIAM